MLHYLIKEFFMNEYKDKNGDVWGQGGAGGAYENKSQRDRDLNKGFKNIAGYFIILFSKPRTTGQKILKVITWVITIIIILFIIISIYRVT